MGINIFSFLDNAFDAANDFVDENTVSTVLVESVDFDSLLTDIEEIVGDAIADSEGVIELAVETIVEGTGTVTLGGGLLAGDFTVNGILRRVDTDLSDHLANLNDFLLTATGGASLIDGQLTGNITLDQTDYGLTVDVVDLMQTTLVDTLSSLDTPISFTDGTFAVDIDVPLGDIGGTINFAGGDLDLDLSTPYGAVMTSIDFPENSKFEVPLNLGGLSPLNLELDLASGVIEVPILGGLDVPLESLSGAVSFSNDGLVTLALDIGLSAPVETTFEIVPLVDVVVTELLEDFSGDLTLDEGVIAGNVESRLGAFPVMASLNDLLSQTSAELAQTMGVVALDGDSVTVDVDTPLGAFAGQLALSSSADVFGHVSDLFA